jgi:leucyl aminopeptidase
MGAFLAVARGSPEPPKLIVMEYRGGRAEAPPVVLVGKGITFDSGGISIKPAPEMDEMKFDMCGAASVFGALRAAALLQLPLNVTGIVPATENMPDGNATRPGDIVRTMSGRTVEILDTDSEGRLVLCDALTYAERYEPAAVIDIATLTGEIVSALGDVATGMFTNSEVLAARGPRGRRKRVGPRLAHAAVGRVPGRAPVELRGPAEHRLARRLRGDRGVLPLAVHPALPWVHLDIAGTASRSGSDKGATGRPVALLAHFLAGRATA